MKKVFTKSYFGGLNEKKLYLDEDGEIVVSEVDNRPYGGGGIKASPESNCKEVIRVIDYIANDDNRPELYKTIYDHILNSSRKNDSSYKSVAVHCAEKMKLHGEKIYKDFKAFYPVRLNYDDIDDHVARVHSFYERLEARGIEQRRDDYFCPVWCDRFGEILIVKEPNEQYPNGWWEYMNLPIVERAVIREIQRRFYDYDDETMKNYEKRCNMLKAKLEKQGIHRDVIRHIYCDENDREVSIQVPKYDDENDYGSFSYIVKDNDVGRDEER